MIAYDYFYQKLPAGTAMNATDRHIVEQSRESPSLRKRAAAIIAKEAENERRSTERRLAEIEAELRQPFAPVQPRPVEQFLVAAQREVDRFIGWNEQDDTISQADPMHR